MTISSIFICLKLWVAVSFGNGANKLNHQFQKYGGHMGINNDCSVRLKLGDFVIK